MTRSQRGPIRIVRGRFIRDPFPGNRIPTDRMDTVGLNVLKLLPVPNQPGEGPAKINNFVNNGTIQTNNDRYDIRIDWARSDKHTLFGRFTKSPQTSLRPSLYNGNDNAETDWQDYNPRWHLSIGNTFTLSPTLVVNVLLGGGNWVEKQISKGLGYDFTTNWDCRRRLPSSSTSIHRSALILPTTPRLELHATWWLRATSATARSTSAKSWALTVSGQAGHWSTHS